MKKLQLKLPHFHLSISRLTTFVAWFLWIFVIGIVGLLAWYNLTQWYGPLHEMNIPEEKLTQKREQLRVKDFDEARKQLETKKNPTEPLVENPFE